MKKSQLKKLIREAILGDNVPFEAWEVTSNDYDQGPLVIAAHNGEFFTGTGIIEPGSVDKLIDIIEIETIDEKLYNSLVHNYLKAGWDTKNIEYDERGKIKGLKY